MGLTYVLDDNSKFSLDYQELVELYEKFVDYTDEEFMENLPELMHFACVVCYIKQVPSYLCLSDKGIIHELAHLMHIPKDNTTTLKNIRKLFNERLKLAR